MASLQQVFRVRPGEAGLVFAMGALLLINSFALQLADIVAVSGFLAEVGVEELLIVWIIDMLLIMGVASLQSLIVDRVNRIKLLRGMILAFALIYIILRLMFTFNLHPMINYSILFLIAEQQWLFFPLIFWILANDIFDMSQAKRLFPLMASFDFIGRIIGMAVAGVAPTLLVRYNISSAELLNINVLVYLVAYLITAVFRNIKVRETNQKPGTVRETLTEGLDFIKEVPAFRYLVIASFMTAAAITVFEFHFLLMLATAAEQSGTVQTSYSFIRLAETVLAIVLQSFLTSRIIERAGLKNTFVILPILVLLAATWVTGIPTLTSVVLAWMTTKVMLNTVDQSARKSFQALVPEERRGRVSMFMDSYLFASGVVAGAIVAGIFVVAANLLDIANYTWGYLVVAFVMGLIGVGMILKMRTVYDTSLFNWRLKRRQRTTKVLDKLDF